MLRSSRGSLVLGGVGAFQRASAEGLEGKETETDSINSINPTYAVELCRTGIFADQLRWFQKSTYVNMPYIVWSVWR